MADKKFYKDLNELKIYILDFLNSHNKSKILQDFFILRFEAFIYGNLILNFFNNLNQQNVSELKLPKGKIGVIKNKYKSTKKNINNAISFKYSEVDKKYYENFKKKIEKDFPEFEKIFIEMEKLININEVREYLLNAEKDFRNSDKSEKSFQNLMITKALEVYLTVKKDLYIGKDFEKMIKIATDKTVPRITDTVRINLDNKREQMLNDQREYQKRFENNLYKKWKSPIDKLECLIEISIESGERHRNKLLKTTDGTNNFKREALLKIHARALQIANEILVLIKSGYADGANARWRSLYELAIISLFLTKESNEISERYLDYSYVRRYKEADNYRNCYRKLGYVALGSRVFRGLRRKVSELDSKYGDDYGNKSKDYNWIPRSILNCRNFAELEKLVKLDHLHPFYLLSCDGIHPGSKGFFRLGLIDNLQDKILLVGPSNYGFADPLQNTAISIHHVNVSLLSIEPDFESILVLQIINSYIKEINSESVNIQKIIEKDENKKSHDYLFKKQFE